MAKTIQSIERAAAVLRVLGTAGRPLPLAEIAEATALAKPTVFGITRTLRDTGLVRQDPHTSAYSLGDGALDLERASIDPNDLRAHAMNWADALAARTRLEVLIAVPHFAGAHVVHHVFRPDNSHQVLRVNEVLPFHATALGKALLAFAAGVTTSPAFEPYTHRTITRRVTFAADMAATRARGWAVENGEFEPDVAAVAMPLRSYGGLGVGAVAVLGPTHLVLGSGSSPHDYLLGAVADTAAAISRSVASAR
jgi:DNA-binding IclR family transcriptional regulator